MRVFIIFFGTRWDKGNFFFFFFKCLFPNGLVLSLHTLSFVSLPFILFGCQIGSFIQNLKSKIKMYHIVIIYPIYFRSTCMFFNFHGTLEDLILFGRYNIILIYSFKFHNACFLSLGQKCSNLFLKKKKKFKS